MTDFRSESGLGSRIKLARRQRGYRTTRELADAIPGGNITSAILENVESGRKADISVSQLLNIARALGVPVSMLLVPIGNPDAPLDLPNLSDDVRGMTVAEFDSWLAAVPSSSYRPTLAAERMDIEILNTVRELGTLRRELERLWIIREVQAASGDGDLIDSNASVDERIARISSEAARLSGLLASGGLSISAGGYSDLIGS